MRRSSTVYSNKPWDLYPVACWDLLDRGQRGIDKMVYLNKQLSSVLSEKIAETIRPHFGFDGGF